MLEMVIIFVIEISIRCFNMAWALLIFQYNGTGYIEIAVFILWLIVINFSQNFSEPALLNLTNQSQGFQSQCQA